MEIYRLIPVMESFGACVIAVCGGLLKFAGEVTSIINACNSLNSFAFEPPLSHVKMKTILFLCTVYSLTHYSLNPSHINCVNHPVHDIFFVCLFLFV